MENVTLIGIDLGKHSFHVHEQERQGKAGGAAKSWTDLCGDSKTLPVFDGPEGAERDSIRFALYQRMCESTVSMN